MSMVFPMDVWNTTNGPPSSVSVPLSDIFLAPKACTSANMKGKSSFPISPPHPHILSLSVKKKTKPKVTRKTRWHEQSSATRDPPTVVTNMLLFSLSFPINMTFGGSITWKKGISDYKFNSVTVSHLLFEQTQIGSLNWILLQLCWLSFINKNIGGCACSLKGLCGGTATPFAKPGQKAWE